MSSVNVARNAHAAIDVATDVLTSVSPLRRIFQLAAADPTQFYYFRPPVAPELHITNCQPQPSFTENFHAMVTRSPPNVRCGCVYTPECQSLQRDARHKGAHLLH
jgi:hypothetical protein